MDGRTFTFTITSPNWDAIGEPVTATTILSHPDDKLRERREKRRLHFRVGDALKNVVHVGRDDLASFATGKTGIVMIMISRLELAEITFLAIGQSLADRHLREEAGHH